MGNKEQRNRLIAIIGWLSARLRSTRGFLPRTRTPRGWTSARIGGSAEALVDKAGLQDAGSKLI